MGQNTEGVELDSSAVQAGAFLARVSEELQRVIVGQEDLVEALLVGLLADGHVLLEGVPGLAKSLAVESLARTLGGTFQRIQFTPDLLPADLLGTQVLDPRTGEWTLHRGPIFGHFVLADEINRAPAKVQSALLEAMQERQVTLLGETLALPSPFLVLATQNPIEQEGTYPLPEAQVDRFMLKVVVGYPDRAQELAIVERMGLGAPLPRAGAVATPEDVLAARRAVDAVRMEPEVRRYLVDLVFATREPAAAGLAELAPWIEYGASPRASINLARAGRARAFLSGRDFVTPHDVKRIAPMVLRHRVLTSYEADAQGIGPDQLVARILATVPLP